MARNDRRTGFHVSIQCRLRPILIGPRYSGVAIAFVRWQLAVVCSAKLAVDRGGEARDQSTMIIHSDLRTASGDYSLLMMVACSGRNQ